MNNLKKTGDVTLNDVYELAKENNRMLHAMRRDAFVGGIVKFVFWVALFVVLPYIAYTVYLAPYLSSIQSAYNNLNEQAGTLSGAAKDLEEIKNQIPNIGNLLNQFGGGQ